MQNKMILNFDNSPFSNKNIAQQTAAILSRENNRVYSVIDFEDGFAIIPEQKEKDIYLRPSLRSQLNKFILLGLAIVAYFFFDSLYETLSMDQLVIFLNRVVGSVWLPHESAISFVENISFYAVMFIAFLIFYSIYSRSYFVGPKGVEATIGLVSKDQVRVEYSQVRGINLKQSIVERLLHYGSIEISTSGSDGSEIKFTGIIAPGDILAVLRSRERRG